jgi:5-methylcytosine-specific restriction endonuclease McrA
MADQVSMKFCSGCYVIKARKEFPSHNTASDGLSRVCRACKRAKALVGVESLRCTKCRTDKPLSEFYKRSASKNGYMHVCKACKMAHQRKGNEQRRIYAVRRYKANPEHCRELVRASYRRHPDRAAARFQRWLAANPNYYREWAKLNYFKVRKACQLRHARKWKAEGYWEPEDIAGLLEAQNGCCAYCSVELNGRFDIDHIVPFAKGGTNWPSNLALACQRCNKSKGNKLDWKPRLKEMAIG